MYIGEERPSPQTLRTRKDKQDTKQRTKLTLTTLCVNTFFEFIYVCVLFFEFWRQREENLGVRSEEKRNVKCLCEPKCVTTAVFVYEGCKLCN